MRLLKLIRTAKENNRIDEKREEIWGKTEKHLSKRIKEAKVAIKMAGTKTTFEFSGTSGGAIYTNKDKTLTARYDLYRQSLRLPAETLDKIANEKWPEQ